MLIKEIELKNFGIHRSLNFSAGSEPVIGLIGRNGSGKSTILNALRYAYTGDLDGTIESAVTAGQEKGYVRVEFEKDGEIGILKRDVGKSPRRELTWSGEKFTSVKDVENRLSEILGVDKKAFSNACFLKQGSLNELLFGTESNREQLFIKLVNLSFLEKFCSSVDLKIKAMTAGMDDLTSIKDELLQQKSEEMERMEDRSKFLDSLPDPSSSFELLNKLTNVIMTCEELRRVKLSATNRINEHKEKLNTVLASHDAASVDALHTELSRLQDKQKRLIETRQILVSSLNAANDQKKKMDIVESLPGQMEECSDIIQSIKEEIEASSEKDYLKEDEVELLSRSVNTISFELKQLGDWYSVQSDHMRSNLDRAVCPTCRQEIKEPPSQEKLEELSALIRMKAEEKLDLEAKLEQASFNTKLRDSKIADLKSQIVAEEARKHEMESTYNALKDDKGEGSEENSKLISEIAVDLEAKNIVLSETTDKIKTLEADFLTATRSSTICTGEEQKIAEGETTLEVAQQAESTIKRELEDGLKKIGLGTEEGLASIKLKLEEMSERRDVEKGRLVQAEEALSNISSRLSKVDASIKENESKLLIVEELKYLKELLSKKGLPRSYIDKKFHRLAKITAENLAILNSDFTVDVSSDAFLSFVFERFDGTAQVRLPMSKMSGGQKVRLCIAFLLAVQQDLVTEVGFQTFDEPSTHLDEEGVDRLCSLFQKLQEILNTAEHQVWVCDHNPILEGSFNKTLTL